MTDRSPKLLAGRCTFYRAIRKDDGQMILGAAFNALLLEFWGNLCDTPILVGAAADGD
jgi:hypothetical protein